MEYYENVLESAKPILIRAKNTLKSDKIDAFKMYTLANMINEYVDFLEIFKSLSWNKIYMEKEEQLSKNLTSFCDQIEHPELIKPKTYLRK